MKSKVITGKRFADSACYKVVVAQKITQHELDVLGNFFIGNFDCKNQNNNTVLEGHIKDQVALSALLNYLSDSHYVLIAVKAVNK